MTSMNARQNGRDFVIAIMTDRPVQPNAVRGVPPSDAYTLLLRTREATQRLVEERVATARPQTLRVPTGPFASNAPITMDLRDTELRDVFRMFGQQVNKNIIIHDSLPPMLVTMTFRNSPLSNVFGYLMRNYNLAYEFIDQNTIVVGTATGLARISGREETKAFRIAYAAPGAVRTNLLRMTRIEDRDLVVDERLRTIFATGTPDVLEEVSIAIQRLDNPGRQVMIHARILEFQDDDALDVVNTLNAIYNRWEFNYSGGSLTVDYSRYGGGHGRRAFDMMFEAQESRIRARTLANPSVITIDGMQAVINLTTEVPYISARDDAGNPTWSTVEIGPRLTFTPRIGRDNTITLDLDLQASERGIVVATPGGEMPTAVQRQVITNVRVRNGEPFVVGGLYRTEEINNRLRVPVLGHLPLLGELFTFRQRGTNVTQVVMIVIPYILDTPDVMVEQERVMMRR